MSISTFRVCKSLFPASNFSLSIYTYLRKLGFTYSFRGTLDDKNGIERDEYISIYLYLLLSNFSKLFLEVYTF